MRRVGIAVVGIAAIGAIGGGLWWSTHRVRHVEIQTKAAPVTPSASEVTFSGRAVPRTIVEVQPPTEGTLEAFFVDVGAEVIQGQLLGRVRNSKSDSNLEAAQEDLDRTRARLTQLGSEQIAARLEVSRAEADRTRAQAELDRLQKAYERQKGLWAAGATARLTFEKSEKDYNDAKDTIGKQDAASKAAGAHLEAIAQEMEVLNRAVTEKSAAIERSKAEVNSGEVHSPVDGVVIARHGEPGDSVDPSTKLMEIAAEPAQLQAIVSPDMASMGRIHPGMPATVVIGDQQIEGVVQDVQNGQATVFFTANGAIHSAEVPVQVRIKF